jgi:hypothetical protein
MKEMAILTLNNLKISCTLKLNLTLLEKIAKTKVRKSNKASLFMMI